MAHNIVAVYPTPTIAEQVVAKLESAGVPAAAVQSYAKNETEATATETPAHRGFWSRLFGTPEHTDYEHLGTHYSTGRTIVTVIVSDADASRIEGIMAEHEPINIEDTPTTASPGASSSTAIAGETIASTSSVRASEVPGTATTGGGLEQRGEAVPPVSLSATQASETSVSGSSPATTEQVIPLHQEELVVGKTQSTRTTRIRTFVTEHPVERQIALRNENVTVERRVVEDGRPVPAEAFKEREVEFVETREEPVVEKQAAVVEEVVVRKHETEREETVRDTVRREEVEHIQEPVKDETVASTRTTTHPTEPSAS